MKHGYEDLDIYRNSKELAIRIHQMSLGLPPFELYEEGCQIRRSSKSVPANIVEGYCLRRHKNEYLQYLHRALGSCQETRMHLHILFQTGSLSSRVVFDELNEEYHRLGRMIFRFIESVNKSHTLPPYMNESDD